MTLKMFLWHQKRGNKQEASRILGPGCTIFLEKLSPIDKLNYIF